MNSKSDLLKNMVLGYTGIIIVLMMAMTLPGCYTLHLTNSDGVAVNSTDGNQPEKIKKTVWWWGGFSEKIVRTDKCEGGSFAKVTVSATFLEGMINIITFGICRPLTIEYYCNEPCNQ